MCSFVVSAGNQPMYTVDTCVVFVVSAGYQPMYTVDTCVVL